ncbi:MAG TPA: FmdB family zinc ribbon protein [Balneolaceae bacterium]|nr:FmdB family zinc ribbon protein [Balneolaceae bacterium]
MPTYEYRREDGSVFEIHQSINDEPLKKCPETGQKVKRIISGGGGVVYKGDGWYVTDYKDNDRKQKAAAEKKSSKKEPADKASDSKN